MNNCIAWSLKMRSEVSQHKCDSINEFNTRYSLMSNKCDDGSFPEAFPVHQKDVVRKFPEDRVWTATCGPLGELIINQGFHCSGVVEYYISTTACLAIDRGVCFIN